MIRAFEEASFSRIGGALKRIRARLATVRRWTGFRVVDYNKNMILVLRIAFLDCGPVRKKMAAGGSH